MKKRIIQLNYILIVSTSITVVFIGIYGAFFQMSYGSSGSYGNNSVSYSFKKQRNFFKAHNILIIDNLSGRVDSLSSVIKKDGTIKKLYRHVNGKLIEISPIDIKFTYEKQKKALFEYY